MTYLSANRVVITQYQRRSKQPMLTGSTPTCPVTRTWCTSSTSPTLAWTSMRPWMMASSCARLSTWLFLTQLMREPSTLAKIFPYSRWQPKTLNCAITIQFQQLENLTLAINSAKAIGCVVIGMDAHNLNSKENKKWLILSLLWQLIKMYLFKQISIQQVRKLLS